MRVVEIEGVTPGHRVACHWAEQIAAGEIEEHEVSAEFVQEAASEDGNDSPFGAASVTELE
jgi:peptide/nickel transport system ATP-binding protein